MKKELILEIYKGGYSSSPIEIDEDGINLILKHDCECTGCGKSIFNLDDFPVLLHEKDSVLCEECYDDKYRDICHICQDSYDILDFEPDYFVITKETEKETGYKAGIYQILKKPFFYGNILTGFDGFFEDSIKQISNLDIEKYQKEFFGSNSYDTSSGFICYDCEKKFAENKFYIKKIHRSIFFQNDNEYIKKYFSAYSDDKIKAEKQRQIHLRITERGIIQNSFN